MSELDKYNDSLKKLNEKFSNYEETDNRVEEIVNIWEENDEVMCINNNFMIKDASHGKKEGLSFGKIYKIISVPELDMIIIKNDEDKELPYFKKRFCKYFFITQN